MNDLVNHPSHYQTTGKKECIEEMLEFGTQPTAAFCLMSSYKYLYRAGNKDGNPLTQDIEKARWYFNYAKKLSEKDYNSLTGLVKLYVYIENKLKSLKGVTNE